MELQIVSYETAKLLKDKGFDWDILRYYQYELGSSHLVQDSRGIYNHDNWNHSKWDITLESPEMEICSAPTIDLACKWLRDVHKIAVITTPISGANLYYDDTVQDLEEYECYIAKEKYNPMWIDISGVYEKAQEAGIVEALKLI